MSSNPRILFAAASPATRWSWWKDVMLSPSGSIVIVWWYVTLLAATCSFKYHYIRSLYWGGVSTAVDGIFEPSNTAEWTFYSLLLYGKDALEVMIIVMILYLLGHRLLRINVYYLIFASMLLAFVVAWANLMSFSQLQSFLTIEVLEISLSWLWHQPKTVGLYLTRYNFILGIFAIIWAALPIMLAALSKMILWGEMEQKPQPWYVTGCLLSILVVMLLGAFVITIGLGTRRAWMEFWGIVAVLPIVFLLPLITRPLFSFAGFVAYSLRYMLPATISLLVLAGFSYYLEVAWVFAKVPFPIRGHWSTIATSLFDFKQRHPLNVDVPEVSELRNRYLSLVYPDGNGQDSDYFVSLPSEKLIPRHIVIFSLETAVKEYYPIANNPDFPNFYQLSQRAVVSENHHTPTMFTTLAAYSMLSGVYPRFGRYFVPHITFGLASVLSEHGYESTYIDSWLIDWRSDTRNRKIFQSLGFDRLLDYSDVPRAAEKGTFKNSVRREQLAFQQALDSIFGASSRGKLAVVFVQTFIGHYPWKAKPGHEKDPAAEKIYNLARALDALFGSFLAALDERSLKEEVIIVVTGDHGLRYNHEFASLGLELSHSDIAFNVPLILYAPGLFEKQVRLPYFTSHIDVTPTLLELVGVPTKDMMLHGTNILNKRIGDRVTFMMNTGLSPVDGFHWSKYFFTFNHLIGRSKITTQPTQSDAVPLADALRNYSDIPSQLADIDPFMQAAKEIFDLTNAYLMQRIVDD